MTWRLAHRAQHWQATVRHEARAAGMPFGAIVTIFRAALCALLAASMLAACANAPSAGALPTAYVQLRAAAPPATPTLHATPTPPATLTPTPMPPIATPDSPEAQYRAWIAEARRVHPYPQTVAQMWTVMLCESGGDPLASNGVNHGLFQYQAATWAGDWNPYRDQPITDARAQIFATAKAWSDGNQGWWGCTPT